MKREDILFERRPRYRVTRTALRVEGRQHLIADIADVAEDAQPPQLGRLRVLGGLVLAAGIGAWSLGQLAALPFVALLAVAVALSARRKQHTVSVTMRDGRVETISSTDAALVEGLARALRRALAFHTGNQKASAR